MNEDDEPPTDDDDPEATGPLEYATPPSGGATDWRELVIFVLIALLVVGCSLAILLLMVAGPY